jgi:hypothetical protein
VGIGHVAAVFIVVQCEVTQAGDQHPPRRELPGKVAQYVRQGGQGIQIPRDDLGFLIADLDAGSDRGVEIDGVYTKADTGIDRF